MILGVARSIREDDLAWLHALNEVHAVELSSMSRERFAELIRRAAYAKAIDDQAAFLLAFDQDAAYDSPNFLWFRKHLPHFLYVDRVAVAATHRRKGLAAVLYKDLFTAALELGQEQIVCEVNADPPNPASDAFHAAFGFEVMGEAVLEDRGKSVRYLRCDLSSL